MSAEPARHPSRPFPREYDPGMSERKTRLTVTIDPALAAYAERLVEAGKADSVSAVLNRAMQAQVCRDQQDLDRFCEIAAKADPGEMSRVMAHIQAQEAAILAAGA